MIIFFHFSINLIFFIIKMKAVDELVKNFRKMRKSVIENPKVDWSLIIEIAPASFPIFRFELEPRRIFSGCILGLARNRRCFYRRDYVKICFLTDELKRMLGIFSIKTHRFMKIGLWKVTYFSDEKFFFRNFDYKNGCKNGFEDKILKLCSWFINRDLLKIDIKSVLTHESNTTAWELIDWFIFVSKNFWSKFFSMKNKFSIRK